jgi:predicted PurR-regulated permease PerM
VVSTVDNIIKPIVLHGQSKLHPLLALLSVLGGVGALGPIGIFVGPIAVAFLQAALTMLQTELDHFSGVQPSMAGAEQAAGAGVAQTPSGRVKSS